MSDKACSGVTRDEHFAIYEFPEYDWPIFPDEVKQLEERILSSEYWDVDALERLCKGTGNRNIWDENDDPQAVGEAMYALGYHVF